MERGETELLKLIVNDMYYTVEIRLINRPIPGQAQNYILISRSPAPSEYETGSVESEEERVWERKISKEAVSEIFDKLDKNQISPYKESNMMGLDGISYELSFGNYMAGAKYRWWMTPPEGWEILAEIAKKLYHRSGDMGYNQK